MRELKFRAWDGKRYVYFSNMTIGLQKSKKVIPYVYFETDTFNGEVRLGSYKIEQYTGLGGDYETLKQLFKKIEDLEK